MRSMILLGICLVAAGLFLRFGLGLGSPLLYMRDEAAGYLPAPNQRLFRFFSHVETDGRSMRSDDAPAGARLRVLFVGDSVTFGTTYVGQDDIFASLVERSPTSCGPVRTTVAATGGWSVHNELGWLRSRGTEGADVVALVINTADLDQAFAELPDEADFPTEGYVLATSELVTRYLPRIVARLAPAPQTSAAPEPSTAMTTPRPGANAAVLEAIREARRIAEQAGARFVLVYSPSIHAGFERYREAVQHFREFVREEQIDLVDMTDAFAAHGQEAIWFDGIHLRPLAHRLIADRFVSLLDGALGACREEHQVSAE